MSSDLPGPPAGTAAEGAASDAARAAAVPQPPGDRDPRGTRHAEEQPARQSPGQSPSRAPGSRALRPAPLLLLVFLAGTGSMATEICASRLLAPYYGSSTIVWANIIGLILASLSLGYWVGGWVADRRPSPKLLGALVLAAAALVALIPFVARPFLDASIRGIDTLSAGAVVGSFFASLALFAPPVVLLGTVTPFAIRLAVRDAAGAGTAAGRVFALSTLGSLIGTFVPALLSIPLIGTQRTMLGSAALLALAAAIALGRRWLPVGVAVAALLALPPAVVKAQAGLIYEKESRYQFIQVVQQGDARYLYLNEGYAIHSVWRARTVLTGGEWDMFLTAPSLLGRPVRSVAVLGNAAGTTARAYGVYFPQATIDGVEIDPAVTAAGRRFFGLGDNPRLKVFTADARPFLRASHKRYDLILIDAYRQPYVPFYLATREFFRLARQHLTPGGVICLNVSTIPGDHRLARDIAGTLAWELPQVVTWQALRFNQFVVGLTAPLSRAALAARLAAAPQPLRVLTSLFASQAALATRIARPWTDDRAPVEWVTDRMIVDYAVRSRKIPEQLLPTAP